MASSKGTARKSRSMEVCFQCRNRKVRCDSTPGGCENCRRLRLPCSLSVNADGSFSESGGSPSGSLGSSVSNARILRHRTSKACTRCRSRKQKCSGELPACSSCMRFGCDCQYPTSGRRSRKGPPTRSDPSDLLIHPDHQQQTLAAEPTSISEDEDVEMMPALPSALPSPTSAFSSDLPANAIVRQHIDAFFEFVHPIPFYGFIHRASLLHSWAHKTHNTRLVKAICGVSARYLSQDPLAEVTANAWICDAESQIMTRLEQPMLSDIEALMLITFYYSVTRRFAKMMVSSALTARLAYMRGLNYPDNTLGFVDQERRRRLMWSIFVFDTFYSNGRANFFVCPKNTIALQLPCNEEAFSSEIATVTEPLRPRKDGPPSTHIGLPALIVRVLDIRDRVQRLVVNITHHRKSLDACIIKLRGLELELNDFHSSLPSKYVFQERNIFLHAYSPHCTPFVMLKLWYHQSHCDLYRFAIPGFRESLPEEEINALPSGLSAECMKKCLKHALCVASALGSIRALGKDVVISDPHLSMCAFHSARVIAKLGPTADDGLSIEEVLENLNNCHDILEEPSKIYPTTRLLRRGISDLVREIQRAPAAAPARSRSESAEPDPSVTISAPGVPTAEVGNVEKRPTKVFSRYSIEDEVRRLQFPHEQSWAFGVGQHTTGDQPAATQQRNRFTESVRSQMLDSTDFIHPQTHQDSSPPGLESLNGSYDMLMTLGFDPTPMNGQPDMFLDSFLSMNHDLPRNDTFGL